MAIDLDGFDLQKEAEAGATMQVLNPKTGEKTGATCSVLGIEARAYRSNLRRMRDEIAKFPEREPSDEDDATLLNQARNAAAALTGWQGIQVAGEAIDFSTEHAVELLSLYPWLAVQVLAFAGNRGNFGRG